MRERLVNFVHPLTGMSPFLYAAYHGLADVAAALLRPGCGFGGVNDLDGNHRSALHLAARRGDVPLRAGAVEGPPVGWQSSPRQPC